MRRWAAGVAALLAGLTATACTSGGGPSTLVPATAHSRVAILSRDGKDRYRVVTTAKGTVTFAADRTNKGWNSRALWWPRGQTPATTQQSCATFASAHGAIVQQGLALRVTSTKAAVRAITITNNIFFTNATHRSWIFDVHVWRTDRSPALHQIGYFDLKSTLAPGGRALPLPWRLCAQVTGNTLRFEAWRIGETPPAWGDPSHGGTLVLPPGTEQAGTAGWYIGHLHPGDRATFSGLHAGRVTAHPA